MGDETLPGDRRRERSEEPDQALHLQLKHIKQQYGFEFLAIGDSHGYYIAGAAHPELEEMVATFAPQLADADKASRDELEAALLNELQLGSDEHFVVETRSFPVRDVQMVLCVVSPRRDGVDLALGHAVSGIQRIFEAVQPD